MADQERTYTIEEANALVPQVRAVLLQLAVEEARLESVHRAMHERLDGNGSGASAEEANRIEAQMAEIGEGIRSLQLHLASIGVQLRDLEMGLVDFPATRDGNRVWLCWRLADPAVAFWHGTDVGYASRRPW